MSIDTSQAVIQLTSAVADRKSTTPLTNEWSDLNVETSYDIQAQVVKARLDQGSVIVGAKLGLTSVAKQQQMNVTEPAYGWLTSDMRIDPGQAVDTSRFIQPRVEPEIAFVLKNDLEGAHIGAADVIAATEFVAPAVEVIDSRYAGYKFTLPDVVADNSSSAGFVLGGGGIDPKGVDLRLIGCAFYVNGELVATAAGAALLGHPASCVSWLVRKLAARGEGLRAGQVILAGAMTEAKAVTPGSSVVAAFDRLGTIEFGCI